MSSKILMFGRSPEGGGEVVDLLVVDSPALALSHARQEHLGDDMNFDGFEFFDENGQPLGPVAGDPDALEPLDLRQCLERRVRQVLTAAWAEAPEEQREAHKELVGGFLDGDRDLASLFTGLAAASAGGPPDHSHDDLSKHPRGGLHNLCHRVHLC